MKRRNDNHSPDLVIREITCSHQRSEFSNTILCNFSGWDQRIGEYVPIPDRLVEEVTFINICISNWGLIFFFLYTTLFWLLITGANHLSMVAFEDNAFLLQSMLSAFVFEKMKKLKKMACENEVSLIYSLKWVCCAMLLFNITEIFNPLLSSYSKNVAMHICHLRVACCTYMNKGFCLFVFVIHHEVNEL